MLGNLYEDLYPPSAPIGLQHFILASQHDGVLGQCTAPTPDFAASLDSVQWYVSCSHCQVRPHAASDAEREVVAILACVQFGMCFR